jgi:hypothetical protein
MAVNNIAHISPGSASFSGKSRRTCALRLKVHGSDTSSAIEARDAMAGVHYHFTRFTHEVFSTSADEIIETVHTGATWIMTRNIQV